MEMEATSLKDEDRTRCEIWTRVMGYHRPVSEWNIGKREEFAQRVPFREDSPGVISQKLEGDEK